jgi:ELWxxDGT repeat protein
MKWISAWRHGRESTIARFFLSALPVALMGVALAGSPHTTPGTHSPAAPIGSNPLWLGTMGNFVFFAAQPSSSPTMAIFKTDGTSAGTTQVAPMAGVNILVNNVGTVFISAGTKSYFLGNTIAAGQEVWVTDGTTAGTHQVADNYQGGVALSPTLLGLIGTDLIFAEATSDENTMQLFRSDGTSAGTHALSNFAPSQYGGVTESVEVNGKIYVALRSNTSCCQPDLWATDGTTGGTVQIDSNEGYPFHLQPSSLRAFGNSVALLTNAENTGSELSLVDTATNALTILDMVPGAGSGAADGSTIAAMDGYILYLRGNANNGLQLWRSDGTLAGTAMLKDLGTGVQLSQLSANYNVTRVGDRAVFQSENAQDGPQLWGSDGTAAGTVPLISTPTPGTYNQPLIGVVGTHGYYAVYNGTTYQVVVTDGTAAGTHVLTDLGPLAVNGDPNGLINTQVAGDDNLTFIYLYHPDSGTGNTKHLYAYLPLTNVATHLVDSTLLSMSEPPLAFAGQLFFKGSDPVNAEQPWVSDGTVAGTHILLMGAANIPPVAGNDSASSVNDAAVTINVLANDTDADGSIDPTSVQIVSQPAHGVVSVTQSGSVVYTPVAGYSGADSFTYSVKDNQGATSNVATVTVTVTASAPSTGSGSGGGGGSASLAGLLALGSLVVMRVLSRVHKSAGEGPPCEGEATRVVSSTDW